MDLALEPSVVLCHQEYYYYTTVVFMFYRFVAPGICRDYCQWITDTVFYL